MRRTLRVLLIVVGLWYAGKSNLSFGGINFPQLNYLSSIILYCTLYLSFGGYYKVWLAYMTLPRDLRALYAYSKVNLVMKKALFYNQNVALLFSENVSKHPSKAALIFDDKKWSFFEIDEYSNRVANYLKSCELKHGDNIALFMENRPEYICIWLGCAKIGVVPALINFNLRLAPLVHSINVVNAKAVICGAELQSAMTEVQEELKNIKIYISGLHGILPVVKGGIDMDTNVYSASPLPLEDMEKVKLSDNLIYIYTSGTTGLPKAAIIKNSRFVLIWGNTAVIRKKFSVSSYWPEAKKYNCTVGQYVGEICRYLLNSPVRPEEKQHTVKVMFGNGVRPQIWEEFTSRFNMPRIAEFYGATEGIANIANYEGKPGACGFVSVLNPNFYPVALIKVCEKTGIPVRNSQGLCIRCKPGEIGEFVGIIKRNHPVRDFDGYADKKATEKKIIYDVFEKGDSAFLSGDLLVMDELGYVYFKDRTGDTYRWRGENVSSTEVEGIISNVLQNKDAVVYGVEVPGSEGRAGMAAVVDPHSEVIVENIAKEFKRSIPPYAMPVFLRIVKHIDTTGTFKLKKLDLQKEGYNISIIKDKLYYLDSKRDEYISLDEDLYSKILSCQAGL